TPIDVSAGFLEGVAWLSFVGMITNRHRPVTTETTVRRNGNDWKRTGGGVLLGDLQRYCKLSMFHKHHLLELRAGDRDRTDDVQGRKSLSITPNRPFCTPRVQYGSRDDAILGSFWRHAVLSLND